jgi:two-component system, sensor histidine kinase and response regulator
MTTILLIEDNQNLREVLLELCQLKDYDAIAAENGLIGLQMIQASAPDLIICDVDMPVMNGFDLLRIVKADPVLAKIPFLILTGDSNSQKQENLREIGVDALLSKPISVEELLSAVVYFLKQSPSI